MKLSDLVPGKAYETKKGVGTFVRVAEGVGPMPIMRAFTGAMMKMPSHRPGHFHRAVMRPCDIISAAVGDGNMSGSEELDAP